jgi:transcriptional regulator with XRE-family HTH domain
MEHRTPSSESRNFQAPTGEIPVVPQPQAKSGEFVLASQQAEAAEVFTAQHSGQEYQGQQEAVAPPRRRAGSPQKPPEHAPSGELYRGSLIRELRKARGLETKTVSAQLGYQHPKSLMLIEVNRANASPTKLNELAALLDVPVAELEQAPVHPRMSRKGRKGPQQKPLEYSETGDLYLGSRIRKLRAEKGLSINDTAAQVGYAPNSLTSIETNRRTLPEHKVQRIAELLDVPVAELEQAPVHPRIPAKRRVKGMVKHE